MTGHGDLLEQLDETYEDLADWATRDDDEDAQARAVRDERAARASLYGPGTRTGMVAASTIDPPIA